MVSLKSTVERFILIDYVLTSVVIFKLKPLLLYNVVSINLVMNIYICLYLCTIIVSEIFYLKLYLFTRLARVFGRLSLWFSCFSTYFFDEVK